MRLLGFVSGNICLNLGWQGEEIREHQFGEQLQFGGLFLRWLIQLVKRLIPLQTDFVSPRLQVLGYQAFLCELINSLLKIPRLDFITELFSGDINGASKHGYCRSISTVFQTLGPFNKCSRSSNWHILGAFGCNTYWENPQQFHIASLGSEVTTEASGHSGRFHYCSNWFEANWTHRKHVVAMRSRLLDALINVERGVSCSAMRTIMSEGRHE